MVKVRLMVSKNMGAGCATVDVRSQKRTQRMIITGKQDLSLDLGDSIKCVSGMTAAYINPGSPAGAFILTPNPPLQNNGKYLKELLITDKITLAIPRGSIEVEEDIGNINRSTGLVVR